MKRAFIRLFGCILSAIGLSMSYDTTLTVLLDDDSAPGVAYAALSGVTGGDGDGTGTGTGSCPNGYSSGCNIEVPGAHAGWAVVGTCDLGGHRMNYFTKFITGWYVAWPNYKGGGVPTTKGSAPDNWPYPVRGSSPRTIKFTVPLGPASGDLVSMNGEYVEIWGASGTICGDRNVPCFFGASNASYCVGENGDLAGLQHGTCIANASDNYGGLAGSVDDLGTRMYGPIYRYGKDAFVKFGCGLALSDGTCASSYKCCYGPTTDVYTVTGCGSVHNYNTDDWACGSVTTQRVAQPIVFYQFGGCAEQYYPKAAMTGANGRYAMDGFGMTGPYQGRRDLDGNIVYDACPGGSNGGNGRRQKVWGTTVEEVYDFVFDTCDWCSDMTAIYNSSSFSPSITSMGTVTYLPSDTVKTCRASVKGNKDSSGTFDIVGNCYYDY